MSGFASPLVLVVKGNHLIHAASDKVRHSGLSSGGNLFLSAHFCWSVISVSTSSSKKNGRVSCRVKSDKERLPLSHLEVARMSFWCPTRLVTVLCSHQPCIPGTRVYHPPEELSLEWLYTSLHKLASTVQGGTRNRYRLYLIEIPMVLLCHTLSSLTIAVSQLPSSLKFLAAAFFWKRWFSST